MATPRTSCKQNNFINTRNHHPTSFLKFFKEKLKNKVWIWLVLNDYKQRLHEESVIILINQQFLFFSVVCNWTTDDGN